MRLSIPTLRAVAATLLLGVALAAPMQVSAKPEGVATLVSSKGNVTFRRTTDPAGRWSAVFPELRNKLLDHVKTGDDSVATLEFDIGGRVGVNTNSEIEIVSQRKVEAVEQGLVDTIIVNAGGIWAKIDQGKSTQLQVQTSGGVMGIKGTEFVVEKEQDGSTTLAVFEGEVELTPTKGNKVLAPAGTKITFDVAAVPVVKTYSNPEDLRKEVLDGWQTFQQAAGVASSFGVGGGQVGQAVYYGSMAVQVVTDPAKALQDMAEARLRSEASSRVPGPFGTFIPSSGGGGGQEKKPDFPVGLQPDQSSVSDRPTFRWEPVENAKGYVVLMSRDETMASIDWSARVEETATVYPENGQPLLQGRYFWRLIAVDGAGQPIGKASQTWFESAGWAPAQ